MTTEHTRRTRGMFACPAGTPVFFLITAAILFSPAATARAKYIDFDAPGGIDSTAVYDINDRDTIVGTCSSGCPGGAFIRTRDGIFKEFGVSGALYTFPFSISADGTIGGTWRDTQVLNHGFVRAADGSITTFDVPGAKETYVNAINKWGTTTGSYTSDETKYYGFTRSADGSFATFKVKNSDDNVYPGDINSEGTVVGGTEGQGFIRYQDGHVEEFTLRDNLNGEPSINSEGSVAGTYIDNDYDLHGFVRYGARQITYFDVKGATSTQSMKINRFGAIVGYYYDTSFHGFIRSAQGRIERFDPPDSSSTQPVAVNSKGDIAGTYYSPYPHGFLRLP